MVEFPPFEIFMNKVNKRSDLILFWGVQKQTRQSQMGLSSLFLDSKTHLFDKKMGFGKYRFDVNTYKSSSIKSELFFAV